MGERPERLEVGDSTEQVSPSNALSPSFEAHRECLCLRVFVCLELVVRTFAVSRRARTQERFLAACQSGCQTASRHQTQRNLNPSGEYGAVTACRIKSQVGCVSAASNSTCANPLKRFVLSSAFAMKHLTAHRAPRQIDAAKTQSNSSRFMTGGFGVVAPHQVGLWSQDQLVPDHCVRVVRVMSYKFRSNRLTFLNSQGTRD